MSADEMSASELIDRAIAELGDWRGERLAEIRALIHEVDPEVVEEWKYRGSPVWSRDGTLAVGNAQKDKVKIRFINGAQLKDPGKVFNAGLAGKQWRSIDILEGDEIDQAAMKALLREAVQYNIENSYERRRARSGDKPMLLSGGNPQIAKADGDAPVQAYIAAMPEWKHDVGRRLDALIERVVPDVRKAVRWNSPWYGVEGMGWFLSYHVFTRYVKVTFTNGMRLDPLPPGEAKDPDSRWINIHEGELDEAQMERWVRQAAAVPGWYGFDTM